MDSQGQAQKEDLQRQAEIYRGVTRACMRSPGCTAIQTWGFTDKYSWIGSRSKGTRGAALPFDRAYQPKPAYQAMLDERPPDAGRLIDCNPRNESGALFCIYNDRRGVFVNTIGAT